MVFQYVLRVLVFFAPINLACIDTNENTNRICGCPRTSLDFTGHKKRPEMLFSSSISGLYGLLWIQKWCRGTESNCPHGDFQSPALPTELPRHDRKSVYRKMAALASLKWPFSGIFFVFSKNTPVRHDLREAVKAPKGPALSLRGFFGQPCPHGEQIRQDGFGKAAHLVIGRDHVGDHEGAHTGRMGRTDAVVRIFHGKGRARVHAQLGAGAKVDVRRGLARLEHIAADEHVEVRDQPRALHVQAHTGFSGRTGQPYGPAFRLEPVQQLTRSCLERRSVHGEDVIEVFAHTVAEGDIVHAVAKGFGKKRGRMGVRGPNGAVKQVVEARDAHFGPHMLPGAKHEAFGVDEDSVHIENDGRHITPWAALFRTAAGGRCAPCADGCRCR